MTDDAINQRSLNLHETLRGKIAVTPKTPLRSRDDLSRARDGSSAITRQGSATPGV